ncbi:MAG: site-specific DNA-methyltransferase [Xanthomonadales bacterium]|jgi:adenine-specific DNA-methyltransferase|nr:site-specific DNA-methyltransferase [Xanthomonadales bacterium]
MARKPTTPTELAVEALTHDEATRKNIPTAEYQSVLRKDEAAPLRVAYERRNRDLDPQLVWRGKDRQDWSDLVVHAPPLYIQEKIHPKVLIDDLRRQSQQRKHPSPAGRGVGGEGAFPQAQPDLFAAFNGLPSEDAKTEFYQHEAHWANRMILGDSLQVMASLAEREGLRGQVQCIYFDPPYGIKFNSNFQWSTTSRDVKDGSAEHITREPEQVKAFRDTWRDGIHSYLTYLRDRLTVARELLTDSGSIFVQIGQENVHRMMSLLDEVFGNENMLSLISISKSSSTNSPTGKTTVLPSVVDFLICYAKDHERVKFRQLYRAKEEGSSFDSVYGRGDLDNPYTLSDLTAQKPTTVFDFLFEGLKFNPLPRGWRTTKDSMERVARAGRIERVSKSVRYRQYLADYPIIPRNNFWADTGTGSFTEPKTYVVQTGQKIIERCLLMATDPGDLVLDPTCGSGTTAYVAEQWGRRWITIDTSRVALALARARLMGARYAYYLLADTRDGQLKEAEITRRAPSSAPTRGNIRQGFVYERVPHITLKSIANNAEIDVIWERWQQTLEPLREQLNGALKKGWPEWEIPRDADLKWPEAARQLHAKWWEARIARQREIDASIAAKADFEYLYDKPYEDKKKVRVAGPFTVESLSPHRVLGVGADDELLDPNRTDAETPDGARDFVSIILENLKTAGVQQPSKDGKIDFTALTPWPGDRVCAEGRYRELVGEREGEGGLKVQSVERRAAIFIGPEFGTVSRPDLVAAAREAADAGFDVLIACAFSYDAHSTELHKLGRLPILKARMNADLHMAEDLKNTGKGNLFVIFGEPDIQILDAGPTGRPDQIRVQIHGVDVFHPSTGEVVSDGPDGIACWFIDTDYNEESFFVRHAYFLGAGDPYKSLKTTLKAEIDPDAWATLNSDISRPFDKPGSGRIAVKVINHLGDEVMRVFRVD